MTEVRCSCGAVLIESIDAEDVQVGDEEFRFARSTDYIACEECGFLHKVTDLRAGLVGGHSGADEALEVLRDLALDDPVEDPSRTTTSSGWVGSTPAATRASSSAELAHSPRSSPG